MEIFTPTSVFRRAAGFLGGVENGDAGGAGADGMSAGRRPQNKGSGSAKPRLGTRSSAKPAGSPSSFACRRARGEVGVRCRGPLLSSGGVGEVSKPGGRTGEMLRRGLSMEAGEQSSMSVGLFSWMASRAALASSRLQGGGRTEHRRGGEWRRRRGSACIP